MKLGKPSRLSLKRRVERLEAEMAQWRAARENAPRTLTDLLSGDGKAPLSQVISEYLYGEEEGSNG